ncbi:hypothetical protein C7460_104144 [Marinoscillum furvescens DSM 4134]|uniref:Uncharacterized protein n=1 Tax=Marinoscillum furvescens DSM 4134 TaxID=1122208 RepID=A0A3D9L6M6_MARFU|nr:hypothetical protein C7460_104144 [Marinoscillum furvescens DSM 4134]
MQVNHFHVIVRSINQFNISMNSIFLNMVCILLPILHEVLDRSPFL